MQTTFYSEPAYMEILRDILNEVDWVPNRTGIRTKRLFNRQIIWAPTTFPFSTTRPLGIKNAWEEMRFFLSGSTDTKELEQKGIMFWKGNTSREFLDSRGMSVYPEGDLGSAYSKQFRNASGIDQLRVLVDGLKNDPYGRRHSIDLWNITEQETMPLLPCWWRSNWSVDKGMLHLKLYSRSNDLIFGYWMAAMQYRLLQMCLARMLDLEVGMLVTDLWDVHVYENQYKYACELLTRDYGKGGSVELMKDISSIDDILETEVDDFKIVGYEPNRSKFKNPRPPMAV